MDFHLSIPPNLFQNNATVNFKKKASVNFQKVKFQKQNELPKVICVHPCVFCHVTRTPPPIKQSSRPADNLADDITA